MTKSKHKKLKPGLLPLMTSSLEMERAYS